MIKEEIIKLAREAGLTKGQHWNTKNMTTAFMCDFANLVAAHKAETALAEAYRCGYEAGVVEEREACAKVCESLAGQQWVTREAALECSDAIRARGNT